MNIEEVAEKTYRLEVFIPKTNWLTAVYFIDEGQGVMIEPGPATAIPSIQEAMEELGMKELAYIIPTHIHLDHAGAIGGLACLFPQAKVVLHPLAVKHAVDPSSWIKSTKMSFGDDFEADYGAITPVPRSQVKVAAAGEIIPVNDREFLIIYAPGHAPHQIVIFDQKTRGLFCGEALGLLLPGLESSPIPAAAPPAFNLEVYLKTMEMLRKLNPRILFYSHSGLGREIDPLISSAAENTRVYADIILEALRQGVSIEAIIRRIREYIYCNLGVFMKEVDQPTLEGYISYFKKSGLV